MSSVSYGAGGTVLMAGLPQTGKSTFLGALYHVLESGTSQGCKLSVLPSAREHLEGLRERWLRVEREPRTPSVGPIWNTLSLLLEGGREFIVRWPDLSGEYFDVMVRNRTLDKDVADVLDATTGVMLFVHPDTITQQPRIGDVERLVQAIGPLNVEEAERVLAPQRAEAQQVSWDPLMVPGQVLVMELLQLLISRGKTKAFSNVCIIISAWDLVCAAYPSPLTYMERQLPLLNQFLLANVDRYRFGVFGVSALGGDAERDKERLEAEVDPAERIHAVSADGTEVETGILAPLNWLIE